MAEDYVEDAALANLQDQLLEKDRIIHEKTQELQGKDEELRVKTQEIRRKDVLLLKRKKVTKYLPAALCLAIAVIGVYVAKQDWNITQLESSIAEKEQSITQLQNSLSEKEQSITQLQNSLAEKEQSITQLQNSLAEKEQYVGQLQSSLAEKEQYVGQLQSSLAEKEQYVVQLQSSLAEKEEINILLQNSLAEKEQIVIQLQNSLSAALYTCHVSGPGLSATANYVTHVIVELSDASGQPCSLRQNVTAELQSVNQSSVVPTTVSMRSPSQYEVSYTVLSRGQHKLHVRLNGSEVSGSPFNITVYPDPTQLGTPVRVVTLSRPWGIAISKNGEMVVSSSSSNRVFRLDCKNKVIQTYGSEGKKTDQMTYPTGIAVDSDDNVYVASQNRLQKFSRDGHLIKCVDQHESEDSVVVSPRGIQLHDGYVYVCDRSKNRIQVFDTALNFIQTIGGRGEFDVPYDLDFDTEGRTYIVERSKHQVQVIDTSGQFVQQFGPEEGEEKLDIPTAVHVMGQFVYVSDWGRDRIAVYQTSGQFVTSFGKHGSEEGEVDDPYGITSDQNGFVYVADYSNNRVQIF